MDAETAAMIAQMMADLGTARRDEVSAPLADGKGRPIQEDSRRECAVQADVEARRANTLKASAAGGDRGAKMRAWNTADTFEADSVTAQLTDRFSGQGHREELSARQRGGPNDRNNRPGRGSFEDVEARFGEERALYQQGRTAPRGNYVATASSPTQGRSNTFGGSRGSTPRFVPGATGGRTSPEHARVAPPRNPNRAPSPRSQGTTRFVNGVRVTSAGRGMPAGPPPSTAPVSSRPQPLSRPPTQPAAMRVQQPASTTGRPPPTAPTSIRPLPVRPAAMRSIESHSHANVRPESAASIISATTNTTHSTTPADPHEERNRMMAEHYVANPGQECDEYLSENPDRARFIKPAWNKLLKQVFLHARDQFGRDADVYIDTHKDRDWMLQAAVKAKDLVENDTQANADAYYAAHPELEKFRRPAEFYFKPKQSDYGTPATTAAAAPIVHQPTAVSRSEITLHVASVEEDEVSSLQSSVVYSDETAASEPPPTSAGTGTISASFHDYDGTRQGEYDVQIDVPVHMHVNITSRSRAFDVRELIAEIEALAKRMQERIELPSPGVWVAQDGVWVEEDEEEDEEL